MGRELARSSPAAAAVLERAEAFAGSGLGRVMFDGPAEALSQEVRAQVAVVTVDVMAWAALAESGRTVDYLAGYSLGAIAAMVAGGALELEGALAIVLRTAEIYEEELGDTAGGMVSITGLGARRIEELCRAPEIGASAVTIAAHLQPELIVVSGAEPGLSRVCAAALGEALRVRRLPITWPVHSPIMAPVMARLGRELARLAPARDLRIPVLSPFDGGTVRSAAEAVSVAGSVVGTPQRWDLVLARCEQLGLARFYECGAGDQLARVMRRWRRGAVVESAGRGFSDMAEAV